MSGPPPAPTYGDVWGFPALCRAFAQARRAKRGRGGEPAFYLDLERNLLELSDALRTRRYRPDPLRYFQLRTGAEGKRRTVSEASFRDRVVHHALVAVLEPAWERVFIEHSYACRRGRGMHGAVARARALARQHAGGYFLRLDVRHHFDHIDHEVLLGLLAERAPEDGLLWLCRTLMEHAGVPGVPADERRGLPIGNLTSQLWANIILDPLDHHVRDHLGLTSWTRYMDDMLLVLPIDRHTRHPARAAKARLWETAAEVGALLERRLRLHLKPSATLVAPVQEGIPWLGLRVFPELVRLTAGARRRMARTLRASGRRASQTPGADEDEAPRAAGVAGHGALADSLGLRRDLLAAIPLPPGFG